MNILVTGGLGVSGAWVTRQLLEEGHHPVVYENRMDTALIPDIVDKIKIVMGDIMDLPALIRAVKEYKVQRICHLAALMGNPVQANPWLGFQVNAIGTLNVLEAARIMNVERVVFTSSIGVSAPFTGEHGYPNYKPITEDYPKHPISRRSGVYCTAKLASELMCFHYHQNYGLDYVVLRIGLMNGIGKKARHGPVAIYGKMIENAMLGKPTTIPQGCDERSDIVYARDIANSVVLACFAQGLKHREFNIGTGEGYTLRDVADAVKKLYPEAVIDIGPGLDYLGFNSDEYCIFDISRASEELGYSPQFTLEQGVKDYAEIMKKLNIEPTYSP
jgi:UDP-glucose 4-epimerase